MRFRPCIDLKNGQVVQIVGGTLRDNEDDSTITNFSSEKNAAEFAHLYRQDGLTGGHVIALGPGNQAAALAALQAFPGGLQMGGGITPENAALYLDAGASHVIVTSYVFHGGQVDKARLAAMVAAVGRERLVLDLSCRLRAGHYWVVTDRWQRFTDIVLDAATVTLLAEHCAEFLVHGVDVEGLRAGIEEELVTLLGHTSPIPITYAGGIRSIADLELVRRLGEGRVDATIGSALDIFGGDLRYRVVVDWHHRQNEPRHG